MAIEPYYSLATYYMFDTCTYIDLRNAVLYFSNAVFEFGIMNLYQTITAFLNFSQKILIGFFCVSHLGRSGNFYSSSSPPFVLFLYRSVKKCFLIGMIESGK